MYSLGHQEAFIHSRTEILAHSLTANQCICRKENTKKEHVLLDNKG